MAGITDVTFRGMIRSLGGCGLTLVDFVASEALHRKVVGVEDVVVLGEGEHPVAVQIYGRRPEAMAEAAAAVVQAGADVVDINMGCPARKIVSAGAGVALMADLPLASDVVAAVVAAVKVPVTVKMRLGLEKGSTAFLRLAEVCERLGVAALTLHPRYGRQGFSGRADWSRITELKASVSIPVIGNGDVKTAEDALRMMDETGCDGVMIGRAALVDPWIFAKAARLMGFSVTLPEDELRARIAFLRAHVRSLVEHYSGKHLLHKLKLFVGKYSRGFPGAREMRRELSLIREPEELLARLESYLNIIDAGGSPT